MLKNPLVVTPAGIVIQVDAENDIYILNFKFWWGAQKVDPVAQKDAPTLIEGDPGA